MSLPRESGRSVGRSRPQESRRDRADVDAQPHVNESVVAVLRRAHLERATRWLHRRVQPWEARRNYIDDARLEQVLPIILTPESNCVDVGAHAGSFLTILTEVAPKGRHIAFEPV